LKPNQKKTLADEFEKIKKEGTPQPKRGNDNSGIHVNEIQSDKNNEV
jgi:ABC-type tungstate transport system permease subunit